MTTVRVLTPPGRGAIATIELAGPDAWAWLSERFRPHQGQPLPRQPRAYQTWFGTWQDEVVVAVKSLEPCVIEIHTHGGEQVVRKLVAELQAAGASPPATSAPSAAAPSAASLAWELLPYALTLRTASILLDQCSAPAIHAPERYERLRGVGEHLTRPWRVVIAGAPNVGKSTLINTIAGYQRSVVSPVAGTTRDVISTLVSVDGWPIELIDTAGLRETVQPLEASGIAKARQTLTTADLVIWLVDASEAHPVMPPTPFNGIIVANKADQALGSSPLPDDILAISARTGDGVPVLLAKLIHRIVPIVPEPGEAVPLPSQPETTPPECTTNPSEDHADI